MLNVHEINTERLILRGITPAVIQEVFHKREKESILQFFGFDEVGYNHLKNMYEKGMETHRTSLYFFLLVDRKSQIVIGECGYHTWNTTHHKAELFYLLRDNIYKRRGFMTEALEAILTFGFGELNLHRVEALVAVWNTASIKLLQHFDFIKEGVKREDYLVNGKYEDSISYALLKREWMQKNKHNSNFRS
jgi:ribosomal-protein-alanine N-acetyltransferase